MELRRLHPDGRLDRTFGDHGVVAFARSASYEDVHLAYDRRTGKSYVSTFLDNGTTSPTTIWGSRRTADPTYGSVAASATSTSNSSWLTTWWP